MPVNVKLKAANFNKLNRDSDKILAEKVEQTTSPKMTPYSPVQNVPGTSVQAGGGSFVGVMYNSSESHNPAKNDSAQLDIPTNLRFKTAKKN